MADTTPRTLRERLALAERRQPTRPPQPIEPPPDCELLGFSRIWYDPLMNAYRPAHTLEVAMHNAEMGMRPVTDAAELQRICERVQQHARAQHPNRWPLAFALLCFAFALLLTYACQEVSHG